MLITNKFGLPQVFINTMTWEATEPDPNRISVTDLLNPPQIRKLKIGNWDKLEDDISNRLWLLLGKAVHYILEKGAPEDSRSEEKLTCNVDGFTLVGIADLLHNTEISDFKITSVYSFLLGDKPEWENQLNCYAYLYRKAGFEVNSLKIYAILRDWQSSKVNDPDYPVIPFKEVSVSLWPIEGQERYILSRLEAHKAENPECSNEERWLRGEKWAVYKKGYKQAFRLFDSLEEAEGLVKTNNIFEIQHRKGKYNRCEKYCPVANFCEQWAKESKNG